MTEPSFIRTHRWKLALALLAVLLLSVLALRWWQGPELPVETVLRRDFVQSVVASGHVEAPHRVDIGAQITGTVLRVPVAEGQNVQANDVLIELNAAELRAAERQAEVAVVQALARLRQMREVQAPVAEQAMRQAMANLENARNTLRRNEDLFSKGFISTAAVDDARKAAELADAQLQTTRKQLETARPSGSDYAIAQAAVAEAEASLAAAKARSRYATIRAPFAGTLIARNVEVGDVVQSSKVLMTLSPVGRTQLVVEIDEKNLHLLALGQQALASADAYAQQRFAAELVYINPGINAQTGAVEVKLDVPQPPTVLKQDMTVSVDIAVARRSNALLVASSVMHDAARDMPWVLVVENARAVRRVVKLGLNSGGYSEVLTGLREGDRVLPASALISDGEHVRVLNGKH